MEIDKLFIRHCIRYEFHQGKSVRKACESICSVLGDNIVSKSTCEYWYKRFQAADFDVSDGKTTCSTTWDFFDNPKRKYHWVDPGEPTTSTPKRNLHCNKVMLCIL